MMKLAELNPRWYTFNGVNHPVGLTFDCPHCRTERIGVSFHHRGREAMEDAVIHAHSPSTKNIWTLDGDTFETLSLSPSVDASASGHWHGFVRNGEIG